MKSHKTGLAIVALSLMSFQAVAVATEMDHVNCSIVNNVSVNKMGLVDENMLQKHIRKTEKILHKYNRKAARRAEHRKLLKTHLTDMHQAMLDVHDQKLVNGCAEAAHGASLETRIMLIEKRLDVL